jgi:hypothetical protein
MAVVADFQSAGGRVVHTGRLKIGRHRRGDRQCPSKGIPVTLSCAAGRKFGFTRDCVAQCENMLALPVSQLDLATGPIASLDAVALRSVIKAIGHAIDSDCEPN